MSAYWLEVAHLVLRYLHVITAIAWIGASFYFVWLDNSLQTPPQWKKDKGIKGDLWAIHGGGFYEVAKYQHGPAIMPPTLHWFKWEAYTTWISGTLLLILMYYVNAAAYLIDPVKTDLSPAIVMGISAMSIVVGVVAYFLLCRTALVKQGKFFIAVCLILLTVMAYGLNHVVSDRAVYIHIGAIIGSIMAANVFFIIMPAQRYMVNEIAEGRQPRAESGLLGKQHSVHNNYATLPIIFIMLSNHFAFTYGHEWGWLILGVLCLIGMWIRHYFNLQHIGIHRPWVLISGLLAFVLLMVLMTPRPVSMPDHSASSNASLSSQLSDDQAWLLIETHCTQCHSQQPRSALFASPPLGLVFEHTQHLKAVKDKVYNRVVVAKDMPMANQTGMTELEREQLGYWLMQKEQ